MALHFDGDQGVIANVGDSRIYRLRDGGLSRLTEDHSLVEQIRKARPMTDEEAAVYPQNIILRALGKSPSVEVDAHTERVQVGDLYLLCSDGLSGMVKDDVIAEIMSSDSTVEAMADQLIDAANQSGGKDNITVIVIKVCPDVG